jgi:hypothetical protein
LLSRGLKTEPRPLNDLGFVVESFHSIPLRIDLFRQFGSTLARAETLRISSREPPPWCWAIFEKAEPLT